MPTDTSTSSPQGGNPAEPQGGNPAEPQGGNPAEPQGGNPPPPRSGYPPLSALRRSRTDRKLAGVAGGLGRYAGVDPLIFRIVFVVLAVFGGSGLLLYALAWLLVPDDGESESEAQKLINGRTSTSTVATVVAGVVALVLGVVLIGTLIDTGPGLGGVGVLAIVGVVVVLLFRGGHRPPPPPTTESPVAPPPEPGAYGQTPGTAYSTAAPSPSYRPTQQTPSTGLTTAAASQPYRPTPHPSGQSTPPPGSTYPVFGPPVPPPPPAPPKERSFLGRLTLCVALIVVGLLVGWNAATDSDLPARVVVAIALGVVGFGLVVGAFFGRARGLVVWGIVLTLLAAAAAFTGNPTRGGFGQRTWRPATVEQLRPTYRLGVGESTLDLARLDLSGADRTRVEIRQGVGDMLILIPDGVVVRFDGDVRAGALWLPGSREANGTDVSRHVVVPRGSTPDSAVLVIDAELGVGSMEVRRATP